MLEKKIYDYASKLTFGKKLFRICYSEGVGKIFFQRHYWDEKPFAGIF